MKNQTILIVFIIILFISLLSSTLSIVSLTNSSKIENLVIVPDEFDNNFIMQQTLNANNTVILQDTNVLESWNANEINTKMTTISTNFSIGSQVINMEDFNQTNIFLNLSLTSPITLTIPIKTNTSEFLSLTSFTNSTYSMDNGSDSTLFNLKVNNTAVSLGNLPPGGYCIVLNINGPNASSSINTKLVPIIVAYDDTIKEWVPLSQGIISPFYNNLWNVTYSFITTSSFTSFPNANIYSRVGFQIFIQYGIGQTTNINWNINHLRFCIIKL